MASLRQCRYKGRGQGAILYAALSTGCVTVGGLGPLACCHTLAARLLDAFLLKPVVQRTPNLTSREHVVLSRVRLLDRF